MSLLRKATPAALAALLAAGCTLQPPQPDQFYRLAAERPARVFTAPLVHGVIEVPRFTAQGLASERPIVYTSRSEPLEVRSYTYHLWSDPPTLLLQDELIDYLRAANVATQVVSPELRIPAQYLIQGRIRRLEQVLGAVPAVRAEIEFAVVRLEDDRLTMVETYRSEIPVASDRIDAAAAALDEAVRAIFARFVEDFEAAVQAGA